MGRVAQLAEHLLGKVSVAGFRHPFVALIAVGVVTVGALQAAKQLRLDPDLTELLPKSFRSVQDLELLKKRFGGVGYVCVVASNAPPEALERFAEEVAPKIEELPAVAYVDYRRPVKFFEDRALYFLDVEDLRIVEERLSAREAYERRTRNPLYFDLEESEPPPLDFSDLQDKNRSKSDQSWLQHQLGEVYYIDRDKRMIVLLAKPASLSSDIDFSKEVVKQVKDLMATIDVASYDPAMKIEYTGRYVKRVDQQALINSDLRLASIVALLAIIVFYVLHFRRLLAVFLILAPLGIGVVWTYAHAAITFETLNILTGFMGAILLGIGDHGIHLLTRYEAERSTGASAEDSIRRTFAETGRAVFVASITTSVAFLGLGFSEFRAFREFGIIASVGMVCVAVAYVSTLPALIGLATRLGWKPSHRDLEVGARSNFAHALPRWSRRILLIAAVVIAAGAFLVPRASFNYDFNALESSSLRSFQLDLETNRILGYSQTPVVILTSSYAEERVVAKALRDRQADLGEASTIDFIAAGEDLIPLGQEEKLPVIQAIGRILERVKPSWLEPQDRKKLADAKRMTATTPYQRADMPAEVRRQFEGPGGKEEGFVLLFPRVSLSDGAAVRRFAKEVRAVPLPDGSVVSAAGEAMILADIIDMVAREAPPVLVGTSLAVFVVMWLLLGSLRGALMSYAPTVATLVVTLGLLPLVDFDLNYINIVMIPVFFGLSVDGTAHIVTLTAAGHSISSILSEAGRGIVGAILTNAFGFGALMLADHPGLDSLGSFAVLGLGVNMLACIVALPAYLAWRQGAAK